MPTLLERTRTKATKGKAGSAKGRSTDSADQKAPASTGTAKGQPACIDIPCDACFGNSFEHLFDKGSSRAELFRVVSCSSCGLVQVNPQPNLAAVKPYYENHYFLNRTDRGYADYYSDGVKRSILSTVERNLKDLHFHAFEESVLCTGRTPRSLDVGCAAGYFVEYLQERGWDSQGIELSADAAKHGRDVLRLPITIGDFLAPRSAAGNELDLITLWASIEHMHSPRAVLKRAHKLLRKGGRMILTTCRYGMLARLRGAEWRYMNVPEHLYFFSLGGLQKLARQLGFRTVKAISYGSGMTTRPTAPLWYRLAKRVADPLVKHTNQGDMLALHLEKR